MGAIWARCLATSAAALWIPFAAGQDEIVTTAPATPSVVEVSAAAASGANPAAEAASARAEAVARLKRWDDPAAKATTAENPALRELLAERLRWLDEWDKAVKARDDAEHPEPSPERLAAEGKADLERVRALLDQSAKDPDALLTGSFRHPAAKVTDAIRSEMKEAIDTATNELKDGKERQEKIRSDSSKRSNPLAALRAERDKIHQRVATLKARNAEREAALEAAKSPEARELARARLVNFRWESRVESERLRAQEALMALESRRADLAELNLKVLDAHVALTTRTLERMQARYRTLAARQERDLKRAADNEQKRAAKADDPLERYRARRGAELLELEARVIKDENALTNRTYPSLEEERGLADHAEEDFARVKHLLDDGRVSHLDALRLNNDFRRITPERERIVKRELAAASQQLAYYENALSGVELDLINDSRDDRVEFDRLLEALPARRHGAALAGFEELERKHGLLLNRHRLTLEKLAARAEQTHDQIRRRLRTLDDQYGFIRTHIFWVRDLEPIGTTTLAQARRELFLAGKALLRLGCEACDRSLWGRLSAEFLAASAALLILPWPLIRLRRSLAPRRQAPRPETPPIQVVYEVQTHAE
jgi:hypothetical protein